MDVKELLGTPYKMHGRTIQEGLDCWGLVLLIYANMGIKLPDPVYCSQGDFPQVAENLGSLTSIFNKVDIPEKNSIIMIKVHNICSHCGIYLGDGYFIHSTSSHGVIIEPVYRYKKRIEGYYKVSNNL